MSLCKGLVERRESLGPDRSKVAVDVPFKAAWESGTTWYIMLETTCVKLLAGRPEFCSQ